MLVVNNYFEHTFFPRGTKVYLQGDTNPFMEIRRSRTSGAERVKCMALDHEHPYTF